MRRLGLLAALAAGIAFLAALPFVGALDNDFVNYDDPDYVMENPRVLGGLTWSNVRWAFTTAHASNWHPLTWLSLQLDATIYPRSPWGYHLTSVVLHALTAAALFLALHALTRMPWRSLVVAAFFAVHPLRVESVAWVAERKDVLCGLFWMLCLLAYAGYAAKPNFLRYLLVAAAFALALLAKPMAVTLPCVLLLLDVWPLKRMKIGKEDEGAGFGRLLLEKLPLFALAAAACVATVYAQRAGGAVAALRTVSLEARLLNAATAYAAYLGKTVWPAGLAPFYPHPRSEIEVAVALRSALIVGAATAAVVWLRRRPLTIGWLWFLGTLVPVIGLVQVGDQAYADRYTYIPHVGLFVALVWSVADLTASWRWQRIALATLPCLLIAWAALLSRAQTTTWNNSAWLWEWTLHVTENNWVAHNNRGLAYLGGGYRAEAAEQFAMAVRVNPRAALAHNNLGLIALLERRADDAARHFEDALVASPNLAAAHDGLGNALAWQGRHADAVEHHRRAAELAPTWARPRENLGIALGAGERWQEAADAFAEAVRLGPRSPARGGLAWALHKAGQTDEAARLYREIVAENPRWPDEIRALAWSRSTHRDGRLRDGFEARRLAEQALEAGGVTPERLDALAAASAELGRFADAVESARQALAASPDDARRARLRAFEEKKPWRE